tara:strand:+ start:46 stop:507 length:462 start_codon:yes stop_codon:yes gene_type:complete
LEKQNKRILIKFLKETFFKFFMTLIICSQILFDPIKLIAYELVNINDNLSECKLKTNCIFQNWKVDDSEKAFTELIQILENTPRLEIIRKDKNYIHAIATSRIMKFIDDIEIKKLYQDNIFQVKSASRLGIYDLGVNKRRVDTLRFRLIDIYD